MFATDLAVVRKGKINIRSITITEDDGSETVINISKNVHYIFGFCKTGDNEIPMEILIYGDTEVVGEIFYQVGEQEPELVKHCVKRATMNIANTIAAESRRSGIDPIGEALKKMPPPERKGGWN